MTKEKNQIGLPRAVICVENPWDFIPQLTDYSIMVVNPNSHDARLKYLLGQADWSLLITKDGEQYRNGGRYEEKLFWYTSGTTGDSKFCSFTQSQLDILSKRIVQTYDISANDRYTSIMPLWHAHGQGFYWAAMLAKCKIDFLSMKDIKNLPNNNPTFITAIPDLLKLIGKFHFKDLRFIRSASSTLPDKTYQQLKGKFNIPIIEAFGMTEALSHCFTNPLEGEQRMGTIGLPDGVNAMIEDEKLYISGPTVCVKGWYDTGDLADQDEAGYYRILGRSKDQINVRGIKLYPTSLERQLVKHFPGINECVIFGKDSVKCLYVGDVKEESINKFLSSLGTHVRPKLVKSVDNIPSAPSGKISRSFLEAQFK